MNKATTHHRLIHSSLMITAPGSRSIAQSGSKLAESKTLSLNALQYPVSITFQTFDNRSKEPPDTEIQHLAMSGAAPGLSDDINRALGKCCQIQRTFNRWRI
jgi:hypothetical protein